MNNAGGAENVAIGSNTLGSNTTGSNNVAIGDAALMNNNADNNTGLGSQTLFFNISGTENVAVGRAALENSASGSNNIGIGSSAGLNITAGSNNIVIGSGGSSDESDTIRIGFSQTRAFMAGVANAAVVGMQVLVDANGQLGTLASSQRFKQDVVSMDHASDAILALRPVTFRYKTEIDPKCIPQFGLVAEEVAKVNPDLVIRDDKGEIYSVRYEAVNAMLLNEFLKQHRQVQELKATAAEQKKELQSVARRGNKRKSKR